MTAVAELEDRLFTAPRIRLLAGVLVAVNIAILGWSMLSGGSVVTRSGDPSSIDFSFIYASGLFAGSAHPAAAYDYAAFSAAQAALFGAPQGGLPYYHFLYPPTFLLFTYPLGLMPFVVAFAAWVAGTFLLYEAAAYAILPRAATLMAAAVPAAVVKNAQLGQNGFLTAGLIGLALVMIERRPVLAGVCLGLLTYKPQFGVLFPLALIAGGQWRAFASAAATALILAILAAMAFGHDVWPAYLDSLRGFDARLSPDQRVEFFYQSVFGWLERYGATAAAAWTAHLTAAAVVAAVVCAIWFRPAPYPIKAASLCAGAIACTPYVLTYDLCVLTMAVAFLVQDGLDRGFGAGERTILLMCFAGSFLPTGPVAPVLCAAILGIAVWRLRPSRGDAKSPPPATARI
jgi:hypothetical protein